MKNKLKGSILIVVSIVLILLGLYLITSQYQEYSILVFVLSFVSFIVGLDYILKSSDPEKQYEFMDYYYNQDLSLSEIGDNNDITRQAVRTILLKSKKKLEEYEEQLKFMQKEEKIKKCIEELEETNADKKILKKIKQQIDF